MHFVRAIVPDILTNHGSAYISHLNAATTQYDENKQILTYSRKQEEKTNKHKEHPFANTKQV